MLPLYGAEHTIVGKELESSLFDHELEAKVGDLGWSRFHLQQSILTDLAVSQPVQLADMCN